METKEFIPPPLRGKTKAVVIIGGGVTGALSAWELSRSGHQVTLIEAGSLGNGSSSRSAACIRSQFSTPDTVRGMRYSTFFYEEWRRIIGAAECPIRQNGYLFLKDYAERSGPIEKHLLLVKMQREQGGLLGVEWLGIDALNSRFPYLETTGLTGATWNPKDGFLFPCLVYNDSAEAAVKNGAAVIKNDMVMAANRINGNIRSITLKSGKIVEGELFINATNAWAPGISSLFGGYQLPIKVERRYLYFLKGLADDGDHYGLSRDNFSALPMIITPSGAYCRPENEKLMTGWLHYTEPPVKKPEFDDQDNITLGYRASEMSGYGQAVRKEIQQFLPAVEDMGKIVSASAGFYATTPDHNPLFGYDPLVGNLIHACGFSGHGLMHAPFSARIVAALAANGGNIEKLDLPGNFGQVELSTYLVNREFKHGEGLVL